MCEDERLDNSERYNHCNSRCPIKPEEVICIPNTLNKSIEGDYFLGQTECIISCRGGNCWAGIVNPCHSCVNCFVDNITISCYNNSPICSELLLNSNLGCKGMESCNVSPGNTTLCPMARPKCKIKYNSCVCNGLGCSNNPASTIVPGCSTQVIEIGGKIIIPPGGSCLVYLQSVCGNPVKCKVGCSWWEEEI